MCVCASRSAARLLSKRRAREVAGDFLALRVFATQIATLCCARRSQHAVEQPHSNERTRDNERQTVVAVVICVLRTLLCAARWAQIALAAAQTARARRKLGHLSWPKWRSRCARFALIERAASSGATRCCLKSLDSACVCFTHRSRPSARCQVGDVDARARVESRSSN